MSNINPVIFEVNVRNNLHRCAVFVRVKSELQPYGGNINMDILYGTRDYYEIDNNNIVAPNMNINALGYHPQLAADYNYNIPLAEIKDDVSTSPPTPPPMQIDNIVTMSDNINVYPGFVRIAPYQNTSIPVVVDNNKYHTCSLTVYVEDPTIGCIVNELLFNRQNIEICRGEKNDKIIIRYVEEISIDSLLSSMVLPKFLINNMKNYGWNNASLWSEITEDDLIEMGFKRGHIAVFFEKCSDAINAFNPHHNPSNDILKYIKYILVKSWNLPINIYCNMIKDGWIDPYDWHLIQDIHFQKMNFKDGHIIKFKKGIRNNRHLLEMKDFKQTVPKINKNVFIPPEVINNINIQPLDNINIQPPINNNNNKLEAIEQLVEEPNINNIIHLDHLDHLDDEKKEIETKIDVGYNEFVQNDEPNISDDDDSDYEPHPIPIVSGIKCKAITTKECRVRWKAYFSVKDTKIDIENIQNLHAKLYMKIIEDNIPIEKKDNNDDEIIESDLVKFDVNSEKYEYKLTGLKQATSYKMKILLFESKNGDLDLDKRNMNEIKLDKELRFNFKTLRYDFYEKPFIYQSDYDENGICYYLGSRFGSNKWDNPSKLGLVSLSSTGWEEGSISDFVGRKGVMSYASHKEAAWIGIDFGSNIKIKVNCYTLRHSNAHKGFYLRNWNFEGSNDGKEWTIIKKHKNDKTFKKKGQAHTWTMNNCNKYYQHFRIIMTNTDSSGCWYMMGTGFEIYGYLTGNK